MTSLPSQVLAIGGDILSTGLNYIYGKKMQEQQFQYNEKAAENADARTRALYADLYSPQAQMQQIKEAGLSPSIYASGGIAGKSGTNGAQGAGVSQVQAPQIDPIGAALSAAQIENIQADSRLKNAQAGHTEAEREYQNYLNQNQNVTNNLLHAYTLTDENDLSTAKSFYEIATEAKDFSEYMKIIKSAKWDTRTFDDINSEIGNKILRDIYINVKEQNTNITTLERLKTNEEIGLKILKTLNSQDFIKLSAEDQINALERSIQANELDKETNEAWNNLLDKLGNGTKQDISIVIGLLLKTLIGNTSFNNSTSHSYINK